MQISIASCTCVVTSATLPHEAEELGFARTSYGAGSPAHSASNTCNLGDFDVNNTTDPRPRTLDLMTIGRSSVDLYGVQIGGRLEDMGAFRKYIGGSPTNIACGAARLGLRSPVITRVGDEHMGRFI